MVITSASAAASAVPPPPAKTKSGTLATAPSLTATRRHLLLASTASALPTAAASAAASRFTEIPSSGSVKALELREGSGEVPVDGDQVAIHYYGRLAAKQGWRFDSTYDHKDATGDPIPFVFTIGSRKVIPGIEAAVKSMRVGGLRRVVIPPSQGYQNTSQEPIPPNVTSMLSGF
ncbi:unnamed protein product [Triticum turgidum subsp. durum]|uniref:peptidylprolyl isomerase n=1 Tax=Triticum turgidum subsp. durum TaxID=4567 RepID=A0A9R1B900_TRITD|nr:unnamed protein product [Triticum turgidum subsp. durum]